MKPILSKPVGWILLAILVFSDAFLDVIRGAEGNPLWKPIIDIIGIKMVPLLVPVVLVLLYLAVKILGWIVQKTDKTPKSEELILTVLVVVCGVFDISLIVVDFFGFTVITHYRLMKIPLKIEKIHSDGPDV